MLAFIAELPEPDLLAAARSADGKITKTGLYKALVDWWLGLEEARRRQTLVSRDGLDAGQLRTAMSAIALRLWTDGADGLSRAELEELVAPRMPDLGETRLDAAQAAFTVGSGSLLVRDDADRWGFVHRSVLEYLVAEAVARELTAQAESPAAFASVLAAQAGVPLAGAREMSPLVVDFLVGAADHAVLERWVREQLRAAENEATPKPPARGTGRRRAGGTSPSGTGRRLFRARPTAQPDAVAVPPPPDRGDEIARQNAVALNAGLGLRLDGLDLVGQDLRRADLTSLDLRGADLRGATCPASGCRTST